MFNIDDALTIHLTRGDIATIEVKSGEDPNSSYIFKDGDVVRLEVFEKGKHENVVLSKSVNAVADSSAVDIFLNSTDTRFCDPINKPKDYWYNIELNPDAYKQTLVGYDLSGPKVFRLYPEGADV